MQKKKKQYLFYKNGQLSSAIGNTQPITLFAAANTPLAERSAETLLTAVNSQNSITNSSHPDRIQSLTYSVYGHSRIDRVLGYTGQRNDRLTNLYYLGNGYRAFSPNMMRFLSPDSLSPFGPGGINSYCYCSGDPTNNVDPSGHVLKKIKKAFGLDGRTKVTDHKKGHAAMEVAREKMISTDEKTFRKRIKDPKLLAEHAKTATHTIPELQEFSEWYSDPRGKEHLNAAAQLVELKVDLKLNTSDPTALMNDGDFLAFRNEAFKQKVNQLVLALRGTFESGTISTSRRSSLTSLQSTTTLDSVIE